MTRNESLDRCALFSDVSVNPKQRLGIGSCLLLPQQFLDDPLYDPDPAGLSAQLCFRRFTDTSSTKLELQTILWGVELFRSQLTEAVRGALQLYTDSQAVTGLPGRRLHLERCNYCGGRSGKPLANASLYVDFFAASDELGFEIFKVAGHSRTSSRDTVQRIFSIVDRGARRALKLWLAEKPDDGSDSRDL